MAAIVATLATGYGVYVGVPAKLDMQEEAIQHLEAQVQRLHDQQRAEERAIIELTVTLRTKGVLR